MRCKVGHGRNWQKLIVFLKNLIDIVLFAVSFWYSLRLRLFHSLHVFTSSIVAINTVTEAVARDRRVWNINCELNAVILNVAEKGAMSLWPYIYRTYVISH